ncbi:MAG TPA: hypothetical protein VNI01_13195, partial [Elusimicrobiota bacterium]|nr:hypothetical protein [Elusimicrobiota bacterium]
MQPAPLLALALIASAASSPEEPLAPCVRRLPDGWREPATLPALLECQSRWRAEYSAAWQARAGSPPPAERLDKLDGFQRGEVREYLARHPDRAATDDAPAAAAARPEPAARAPVVRANAGIRC